MHRYHRAALPVLPKTWKNPQLASPSVTHTVQPAGPIIAIDEVTPENAIPLKMTSELMAAYDASLSNYPLKLSMRLEPDPFSRSALLNRPLKPQPTLKMSLEWEKTSAGHTLRYNQDAPWWKALGDANLDALMNKALVTNLDMKQTAIRLKQAGLKDTLSQQTRYPSISAGSGASLSRPLTTTSQTFTTTTDIPGAVNTVTENISGQTSKSFSLSGSLQYELDLWSRLADQRASDHLEVEAAEADILAAQLSITSEVAIHYWTIAGIDQRLPLIELAIADAKKIKAITKSRITEGVVITSTIDAANNTIRDKKAQLDKLVRDRINEVYTLAILLNQTPETFEVPHATLPDINTPLPELKSGTPASILNSRPDLRAAWLRVDQALYQLQITEKARYPDISLSGSISSGGDTLKNIISNPLGSLGLSLALPFIDWKKVNINVKVSKLQYESTVEAFRNTLYKALVEVENAIENFQASKIAFANAVAAYNAASTQENLASIRYHEGTKNRESWLTEQANKRASYEALIQSHFSLFERWVQLGKALGGYSQQVQVIPASKK